MELQLLGIKVIQLRPGAVNTGMLGVSTAALDRFCEKTEYYSCNAKRFKNIVESVEARNVSSDKVAEKTVMIPTIHPRAVVTNNQAVATILVVKRRNLAKSR